MRMKRIIKLERSLRAQLLCALSSPDKSHAECLEARSHILDQEPLKRAPKWLKRELLAYANGVMAANERYRIQHGYEFEGEFYETPGSWDRLPEAAKVALNRSSAEDLRIGAHGIVSLFRWKCSKVKYS